MPNPGAIIRFALLGPVRAWVGDVEVAVPAGRDRIVLAKLLLHAGEIVPMPRLIDAVWGELAPNNARNQIQGCVSRLRKRFTEAGAPSPVVMTDRVGYSISPRPGSVDLYEFHRLRDAARAAQAQGDRTSARARYREALELWHGPALAGVHSAVLRPAAVALDEELLQAREECLRAELELGSGGELVGELTGLVRQYPYREALHAALMHALYRAGRQSDALAAYRHARQLLHDELGVEPDNQLQQLHQAILHRDPTLDQPEPALAEPAGPAEEAREVPRELPAAVAGFTGRTEALATLDDLLADHAAGPSGPVVISAIAGTAGVGKTALAVHWAHHHADRFPDGQLYLNLQGYGPGEPMTPEDGLARLLAAMGVSSRDIPLDRDERAAFYRSVAAGRQMLILLDNAATVDQVRPLLPGSGSCAVVVTSRDSLAALVALNGARRVDLGLLAPADAVTLLAQLIGDRAEDEPDAAAELAEQCARLPLALRLAAELAISRPSLSLAKLAVELADQQRRLELLDAGGDPHAAVKVVFSWSIQRLPPEAARTFRLLGLHPGLDFDMYATAALAGTTLEQTRHTLNLLTRAHLVNALGGGRCGMHDLLRAYALHLTTTDDTNQQREAARDRLFDYYLATAATAMDGLHPAEAHRRPRVPPPTTPAPELLDPGAARAWLDTERHCLVATAAHAAAHDRPTHAIRLSGSVFRYLDGGHYSDGLAIHGHAHRAAQQTGELAEQAHALRRLGTVHDRMGRLDLAADHLQQALDRFQRVGDQTGEAIALTSLGGVERRLGHYRKAAEHLEQALHRFRQVGDQTGEASALTSLGVVERRLRRYQQAADHLRQSAALARQIGDQTDEAIALNNLGNVERNLANYPTAAEHHEQAMVLFRQLGNLEGEAHALDNLGVTHIQLGRPREATELFQRALVRFRDMGDREGEAAALNGIGEATYAAGDPAGALTQHRAALAVGIEIEQARAHTGLGRAYLTLGEHALARTHYQQALVTYTELDMPDADDIRAELANLDQQPRTGPDRA